MERAQALIIPTGFFQRHVIRNDFHDGSAIANLTDLFLFDHSTTYEQHDPGRVSARWLSSGNSFSLPTRMSFTANWDKGGPR
jgi:hypothetical protein